MIFNTIPPKKPQILELSGSELSKLSSEKLIKLFNAIPKSVTKFDLTGVEPTVINDIKETLSDAGATVEGQEKPAESKGPQ